MIHNHFRYIPYDISCRGGSQTPVLVLGNIDSRKWSDGRHNRRQGCQVASSREPFSNMFTVAVGIDAFIRLDKCWSSGLFITDPHVAADDLCLAVSKRRLDRREPS